MAKLSEFSLLDSTKKIYLGETFRFWRLLQGQPISTLEKAPLHTTYRIETDDKILTSIDEILSHKTCQPLKDGKSHVFGAAEFTSDIPRLANEYSAAFVLADKVGQVEKIEANLKSDERIILPSDFDSNGLINTSAMYFNPISRVKPGVT